MNKIHKIYKKIIQAGVYKVNSIKVAEAAKVIENTQRDINIALINELSIIFKKMKLDTSEILMAANTKWNFVDFKPGLVGGHCIGVDPYYLTYKSKVLGYHPEMILSGRRINDSMGEYIVNEIIQNMINMNKKINNCNIIVLGLTFKENCSDLRNSKVIEMINLLKDYGCNVFSHDPKIEKKIAKENYNLNIYSWNELPKADVIVLAVSHSYYLRLTVKKIVSKFINKGLFVDLKSNFNKEHFQRIGHKVWCL